MSPAHNRSAEIQRSNAWFEPSALAAFEATHVEQLNLRAEPGRQLRDWCGLSSCYVCGEGGESVRLVERVRRPGLADAIRVVAAC